MSATLIPFPLADRLTQIAASGSLLPQPLGGLRAALRRCLQTCADAAHGDDVDIEAIADLDRAVRDPAWDDIDAALVARQVQVAIGWLEDAQREAWVSATADGEDTVSTAWAAERALDLTGALARLESAADWLGRRARPGPPPRDQRAAALGLLDLEWPGD